MHSLAPVHELQGIISTIQYTVHIHAEIHSAFDCCVLLHTIEAIRLSLSLTIHRHTLNIIMYASNGGGGGGSSSKDDGIGLNIHAIPLRQHSVAVRSLKHSDFLFFLEFFSFFVFLFCLHLHTDKVKTEKPKKKKHK